REGGREIVHRERDLLEFGPEGLDLRDIRRADSGGGQADGEVAQESAAGEARGGRLGGRVGHSRVESVRHLEYECKHARVAYERSHSRIVICWFAAPALTPTLSRRTGRGSKKRRRLR